MTLTARLCAICAVSTLIEISLPSDTDAGGMRLICGLLLISLLLEGIQGIAGEMMRAEGLGGMMDVLMR